jgi:hypothetical protein
MAITEILQGCGSWDIQWKSILPKSVRDSIVDGSTILVFDTPITADRMDDDLRPSASFEGVMTKHSTSGISGYELSWLMGQPSGVGPGTGTSTAIATFADYIEDLAVLNGVTFETPRVRSTYNGTWDATYGPAEGPGFVAAPEAELRFRLDTIVGVCSETNPGVYTAPLDKFSWDLAPGMILSAGPLVHMYRWSEVIISDVPQRGIRVGNDTRQVFNVPAKLEVTRSIENLVNTVTAYGNRDADTGVTPTESGTNSLTVKAPDGDTLVMRRSIDGGGNQSELERVASDALADGATPEVTVVAKLSDPWQKEIGPGDYIYVWSAYEPDLYDEDADSLDFFGRKIKPKSMWVNSVTRNISEGMTVLIRQPISVGNGIYTDVTEYVVTSESPATIELADRFAPPYLKDNPGNGDRIGVRGGEIAKRLNRSDN